MIQAYRKDNKDYQNNGDMILFPESCTVSAQLNGTWVMELSHPLDEEERWKYIEEEGVIAAPNKQLFRVSEIYKEEDGITATCYPIFFDSADDCFLDDVRPTIKNGQEALDIMMAGSQYSGESNIQTGNTAYFIRKNLMSAISGEEEPTFLGRWGGEILYDNYKIIINERVGGDYGVEARYGKNIIGIEYEVDMSGVATRIVPVSYNGHTIGGANGYVDSPLIGKYVKKYIREMKFEDVKMREDASEEEESGTIICDSQEELDAALKAKCQEQFALGVDKPAVSIAVDMELLSRTEEYKDYELLETVGLGDTVSCVHDKLGISTQARVVSIEWDCIKNKPGKIELGDFKFDYFKDTQSKLQGVASTVGAVQGAFNPDGSVMAERVKGFLDALKVQLRYQKDIAQKQDVRAILFEDFDPASPTYGAMCIGTQGFQISNRRTVDGRDWEWTTAFTAQGGYANTLITGILSDKEGKNFWNLDTGDFRLAANTTFDGKTIKDAAGDAANEAVKDAMTQTEILNRLSPLGEIYIGPDGRLYISFTAAKGGTLILGGASNGNGVAIINDASGNEIGRWSNAGFKTLGRYFAVKDDGSMYSNNPVAIGYLMMSGTVSGTAYSLVCETNRAPVMSVSFNGSSTGTTGTYTLKIGSGTSSSNWYVRSIGYETRDGGTHTFETGDVLIRQNLTVNGDKKRVVTTEDYGDRGLSAYETPTPMFGDIGSGVTDEQGTCVIDVDDIFTETIANVKYHVFLQKEGPGDIWVEEKTPMYFLVKGTPNLIFSWELKAYQRDYEFNRLDEPVDLISDWYDFILEEEREHLAEYEELIHEEENSYDESIEELYGDGSWSESDIVQI